MSLIKITALNSDVPNAKIRAFGVLLPTGKGFTCICRGDHTVKEVNDLLLAKWPEFKKENGK